MAICLLPWGICRRNKTSGPHCEEKPNELSDRANALPRAEGSLMLTWRWIWWDWPGEDSEGAGASSCLPGTDRTCSLVGHQGPYGKQHDVMEGAPAVRWDTSSNPGCSTYLLCDLSKVKLSTSQFSPLQSRNIASTSQSSHKEKANANP